MSKEPKEVKFIKDPLCITCENRWSQEVCRNSKHGSACGDRITIETCSGYKFKKWRH